MRSVFITRKFVEDREQPVGGAYQRMSMFLEAVSRASDHLDLLVFADPEVCVTEENLERWTAHYSDWVKCDFTLHVVPREQPQDASSLSRYLDHFWNPFKSGLLKLYECCGPAQIEALRRVMSPTPDLVLASRLTAMAPLLASGIGQGRIHFDLDDVEHLAFVRHVLAPPHWKTKKLAFLHLPGLLAIERRAMRAAQVTYVCSPIDRDRIGKLPGVNAKAVPNAVTIRARTPLPNEPTAMFLGSPRFSANKVAADYFVAEVWPHIRRAIPNATFLVGGEFPELFSSFRTSPAGVEYLGFVEDLPALYARSRLVVAPVLSGSGTRLKILEAAAFARPIVSTTLGAEGIALDDGTSILLRDDPLAFASACVEVLTDSAKAEGLADAAHELVRREYDRAAIVERLAESLRDTVGTKQDR